MCRATYYYRILCGVVVKCVYSPLDFGLSLFVCIYSVHFFHVLPNKPIFFLFSFVLHNDFELKDRLLNLTGVTDMFSYFLITGKITQFHPEREVSDFY